ncbi:MAG: signal peptide peptidase SppA [Clostridiales Family XIII bacterium]|jgi:protease-4|nr:signal peptide peptidase SppA [Clostridiales Family XIII bacterium]
MSYASPFAEAPGVAQAQAAAQGKRKRGLPSAAKTAIVVIAAVVIALLVLMASGVAVLNQLGASFASGNAGAGAAFRGPDAPYVAKVSVVGSISSVADAYTSSDDSYHHDWTVQTIDTLIKDENNRGILLYLDTPGGTVYESDALYLKLIEYKEETGRPVYAYMASMAMSGGYYIAAAADDIRANRNTWTGSIGVTMGTLFDVSQFLAEHGVKTETITSGRNKAMGGYFDPITDEQREIFQGLIDDAYDQFVAIIAEGRGMDEQTVRALADGRVYTARQAVDNGLIDGILDEKEAEEAALEAAGDGATLADAKYKASTSLLGQLGMAAENLQKSLIRTDVAAVLDEAAAHETPQPMVLWER